MIPLLAPYSSRLFSHSLPEGHSQKNTLWPDRRQFDRFLWTQSRILRRIAPIPSLEQRKDHHPETDSSSQPGLPIFKTPGKVRVGMRCRHGSLSWAANGTGNTQRGVGMTEG